MDDERKLNHIRGPLHGIPILIKDNIDTHDQMPNTAGSLAMIDNHPQQEAFIIKKLRDAGAIILGKTNLSEWANFRSTQSISGWSSVGGQTKNPYVLDQTPCGSSSGSAVAVAEDFCMIAVGTETDGSIACPASFNAVVGIKPTVGLVSRSGIIPISRTQDIAGPSSVIKRRGYDQVLELFSLPLMRHYNNAWRFGPEQLAKDGVRYNLAFDGYADALNAWRYPDRTEHVEYIADIVRVTIEQEMRKEAGYLRSLRLARERVKQVIEGPDTDIDRIIRSVRDNGGKVSNTLAKEFPALADDATAAELVDALQGVFQAAPAEGSS